MVDRDEIHDRLETNLFFFCNNALGAKWLLLISISYEIICQITGPKIMVDRDEIRDRLETNLPFCRLPRALAVVQRRRADIIKQWSIDDTQSWFYSRSESLDRHHHRHNSEESSEKACSKIPKSFDRVYS